MTDTAFAPFWFSPPGRTMLSMIASRGMTTPQLADRLGQSKDGLLAVIAGSEPIDDALADGLGRELGPSSAFWKQRQCDFEDDLDRVSAACETHDIAKWLGLLPLNAMLDYKLADASEDDIFRSCLVYFDVSSPLEWCSRYTISGAMLKASDTFDSKPGALSLWLRQVEQRAMLRSCERWDADGLRSALPELRQLTKNPHPSIFVPAVQSVLAQHGVALELVQTLNGCTASGTARFVNVDRAAIGLSLRHKTNDHFWFTLFHEIGHLLLHDPNTVWVDDKLDGGDFREDEANNFAASLLIPREFHSELNSTAKTYKGIMRIARKIGIHPGIVVGQLQHSGKIPFSHLNKLKRSTNFSDINLSENL